jgi:hypothetical protein
MMNKKLMALVVTTAITLSSTVAFASDTTTTNVSLADSSTVSSTFVKDTPTKISLDDRTNLSVSLQSNSLVFNSDPTRETYDSVRIYLIGKKSGTLTYTYAKGRVNGATINLNDLSDGSYTIRVLKLAKGVGNRIMKYAFTIDIKGGSASFTANLYYSENLKYSANERTDAYALDDYKCGTYATDPAYIKQANLITAGITDDYLKAKAIEEWVATHLAYSFEERPESDGSFAELFPGSGVGTTGICGTFAGVTTDLFQAAGFPAKFINGGTYNDGGDGHYWTEVYVDNRWVFADATAGWFDRSIAEYSVTHELAPDLFELDKTAWNGSLYITEAVTDKVLKEIKNYTLGGLVTSTYGYNAKDMYSDAQCTKHWNFAADKVGGYKHIIYIKSKTK